MATQAQQLAAFPQVTVKKVCGEYRITFTLEAIFTHAPGISRTAAIQRAEEIAAYESDFVSALDTAKYYQESYHNGPAYTGIAKESN